MTVKLGIVMDPIDSIKAHKDSSLAMLLEAQARGWELYYFEQKDLYIYQGVAHGCYQSLRVCDDTQHWYTFNDSGELPLAELDVILMRKDPPYDMEYLYTTQLLELAEQQGVLVVNKPQSLRDANEKLFATHFPDLMTPTLVSRRSSQLSAFVEEHKQVIFKPLDGMGGTAIFHAKQGDPNISVIIETLTQYGQNYIMAQRFIKEIKSGDKRILMIDGEPVPYGLARIPADGEIRGNLAAGGRGVVVPLNERDHLICERLAPTLRAKGLLFVGIDVIGDYLTEINITSPTCIREIESGSDAQVTRQLFDCLTAKLNPTP